MIDRTRTIHFPILSLDKTDGAKEQTLKRMLEEQERILKKMKDEHEATAKLPDASSLEAAEQRLKEMHAKQERVDGITNAIEMTPRQLEIATRPRKKCRYCYRLFSMIKVHELRCAKNPDRLPGYGGKPDPDEVGPGVRSKKTKEKSAAAEPIIGTGKNSPGTFKHCRFCHKTFRAKGLHYHEITCVKNPNRGKLPPTIPPQEVIPLAGVPLIKVPLQSAASVADGWFPIGPAPKRILLVRMGDGTNRAFIVTGANLEPAEIINVEVGGQG